MKISSSRYSCQKTQFLAMNHNLQRNLSPSSFLNHIHKVPEHFATEADEVINTDESRFCNQRQSLDFYLPSIKRARNIHKKQQVSCQELPQRLELDLLQSPREEIKLQSQKHLDEYQKIKPTLKRNFIERLEPLSNKRVKFKKEILVICTKNGIQEFAIDSYPHRELKKTKYSKFNYFLQK